MTNTHHQRQVNRIIAMFCKAIKQPEEPLADWFCDCKDSTIRWVDEKRQHPAIAGPGWFCMGCLTEFNQRRI